MKVTFTYQRIVGETDGQCNVWATNSETGRVEYIGQLCRNWSRLGGNGWSVPGGSLNLGHTRKAAAIRLYKRDGLTARDYRAKLDAKFEQEEQERRKVFNPQGIEPGDTVRLANPTEDHEPLGDMIVECVGGKNFNKVYCKQVGHELYANCFTLVAKKGSAEQTGFGVAAQTPAQAGRATAERRAERSRQARIDLLLRLVNRGQASSAETSELKGLGVQKKDWSVTFIRTEKKVMTDIIAAFTREEAERIAQEEFAIEYREDQYEGARGGFGQHVHSIEEIEVDK